MLLVAIGGAVVVGGACVAFPALARRDLARIERKRLLGLDQADDDRPPFGFDVPPEECAHEEVREDWRPVSETLALTPPRSGIVDEGGVCRQCGARVVRHGSTGSWTPWTLDDEAP